MKKKNRYSFLKKNKKITKLKNNEDIYNEENNLKEANNIRIEHDIKSGNPDIILMNTYITCMVFALGCIISFYITTTYFAIVIFMHFYYLSIGISKDKKKHIEKKKNIFFNVLGAVSLYGFLTFFNPLKIIEMDSFYAVTNIIYASVSFFILTFNYNNYDKKIHTINTIYCWIKKSKESYKYCLYIGGILYISGVLFQVVFFGIIKLFIDSSELLDNEFINEFNIYKILKESITIPVIYIIYILFLNFSKKDHLKIWYDSKIEYYKKNKSIIDESVSNYKDIFKVQPIETENFFSSEPKEKESIFEFMNRTAFLQKVMICSVLVGTGLNSNYYEMYILKNSECINKDLEDKRVVYLKNGNVLVKKVENEYTYYEEKNCLRKNKEFKIKKNNIY